MTAISKHDPAGIRCHIRTDASAKIGSGHVMRCLSLADVLREGGVDISFICRDLDGSIAGQIEARDYPVHLLSRPVGTKAGSPTSKPHDWLGVSLRQDTDETQAVIEKSGGTEWLVVDHYGLNATWESELRSVARHIMVIDDLANRDHDCDLLLDQNLYENASERYRGRVAAHCRQLLGPRYALLRQDFARARDRQKKRTGHVKRLLIFFGSYDPANHTAVALRGLRLLEDNLHVDVVTGSQNAHLAEIRDLCHELPNATLHCNTPHMSSLMAEADLAIGAGGSTTWERACMGLPSVVLTVADNQRELTNTLAERGWIIHLQPPDRLTSKLIADTIRMLASSPSWLRHLSRSGLELVDGLGATRVARTMMGEEIKLRCAVVNDRDSVYSWRNAESTRRYFIDSRPISYEDHCIWFDATLNKTDSFLLIGEVADGPVGVLRYDLNNKTAKVSIYLVPGQVGKGYGAYMLRAGEQWLRSHQQGITQVVAEVLKDNRASVRAFEKSGFINYGIMFRKPIGHPG